jgi:type IX secretion system substrate protein
MKSFYTVCAMLVLMLLLSIPVFAQATGDYRSAATGNWNNAANWQRYNGSTWLAAGTAPTGSEVITIQSADSIFVNVLVTITDTLKNQGRLGGTGNLTIAGTYQHDEPSGSIPQAIWANGSTCLVTGYTTGSKPSNSNQSFYNFAWNCPNHTSNVDLSMTGNTIGGNFTVASTGVARVYLTSPNSFVDPITINGNVVVTGGTFASNGSSSIATILVTTHGNINVTGGTFGISRGSAPDVTWTLDGDFSVSNATLQNSGGTHINKLAFSGGHTHHVSLSNVTYGTGTSYFTMQVESTATVDLGTSVIGANNSGSFIVRPGGTLATGNPGGINGAVQCTGASNGGGNSFSTEANYVFNGSTAQVTGTMMPATVNDLTINNTAGVALSQATTINGVLHLVAGVFDNTVPFTLGPSGTISLEGGSLLISSVKSVKGPAIPRSFFVDQNYPNPFNPSTTIEFGLPARSFVSIKVFNVLGREVATLFQGVQSAGVYAVEFDASNLVSGIYFCRIQTEKAVGVKRMVLVK